MKTLSMRNLLRNLILPAPRRKAPPRPHSFRPRLEMLEDRTVPSVPSVTGVSPNFGPIGGSTQVQVVGSGFTGATAVDFGSIAGEYFVQSDTLIDVTSPNESAGTVDVRVITPQGESSPSSADQFTYQPATTTTLESSNNNPSTYGQSVTFTVSVTDNVYGDVPTGTVWLNDGGNVIATGTLSQSGYNGGQVTFTLSSLAVGSHSLTADYDGDANNTGSTSSALTQTVNTASTTTTLTSSVNPADPGQAVTFTATVAGAYGGTPTGTVTFYDGTTTLGTGDLSPGSNGGSQATLTVSNLALGSHSITASYGGDGNYSGSSSSALNQTIQDNGAYVWTGYDSGDPTDWNDPKDWLVNGATAQYAPSASSDVIFGGPSGTSNNCSASGAVSIHSLSIDSNYNGTLSLYSTLTVAAGFDLEGGAVNQVNGAGTSDITVNGVFNWVNGILNSGPQLANIILTGNAVLTNNSLTSGSNFILDGAILGLYGTGTWTFNKNAGITIENGGSLQIWSAMNLATSGSGIIQNNGGSFILRTRTPNTPNTCALPYVNNAQNASLAVDQGTLDFTNSGGPDGVSVYQKAGQIDLGQVAGGGSVTLGAVDGLTMDGGILVVENGVTADISGGNVTINGGVVSVGFTMPATLDCEGFVTLNGTYIPIVDMGPNATLPCSVWHTDQNFTIGANATLDVTTVNVPATVPSHKAYAIMTASNLEPAGINGDFGTKDLGFGNAGQDYTASVSSDTKAYDLTTP